MAGSATWTTPRDWTDGETITATIGNAHWRDNLTYLKAVVDSSATVNQFLLIGA